MVASSTVILVCADGAKQTNGEAARSFVLLLKWQQDLPTVMVTASVTFERLLNSRVYIISSGHEMEWARNSCPLNARKITDNLFCNIQMTWNRCSVFLRFKPVNCLVIHTSSSFEQFVLSENLNLVRFHRWKLQNVSIVGSFRFLNVFLKNFSFDHHVIFYYQLQGSCNVHPWLE